MIRRICLSGWVLTVLLVAGCGRSNLFPGDKVEKRSCRWCNGSGIESEEAPGVKPGGACVGCRGAKEVEVVIPGPQHPVWIKGTVRDAKIAQDLPIEVVLAERQKPGQAVAGAVPGAELKFVGSAGQQKCSSNPSGRFRLLLKPGHYQLSAQAKGFAQATLEVEVPMRREPIWKERAVLKTSAGEADEVVVDVLLSQP